MIADKNVTWQEAAKRWAGGGSVWSITLGGIGPGYEQAIQILVFEIMVRWPDKPLEVRDADKKGVISFPKEYMEHVDAVARGMDSCCLGFTRAQVGVAKNMAFQYMHYGYATTLDKALKDRLIIVSRSFPHV